MKIYQEIEMYSFEMFYEINRIIYCETFDYKECLTRTFDIFQIFS